MTAHNKNNFDTDTEIKLWRPQRQPKLKNQNQKIRDPEIKKLRPETQNPKTGGTQKPKKRGQKHAKRQILGKKHTKTHTKNPPPNTKHAHQKKPLFWGRPASPDGSYFGVEPHEGSPPKYVKKKFRRFAAK